MGNATNLYHAQVRCNRCAIDGNLMREDHAPRFGRIAQGVGLLFLLVVAALLYHMGQTVWPRAVKSGEWEMAAVVFQVTLGWLAGGLVLISSQPVWACPKCGTTHTRVTL